MNGQFWWYAARSSGLVAWMLLAASVVWGLAISGKVRPPRVRPAWMLDLHRFLGGLATIFTGVHITSIVADSYVHFGVADILVPFASSWRPAAVAWGVVGMWLLGAVELTSLARRHLPRRVWRRIHMLSLPLYGVASMHFLQAGTDAAGAIVFGLVAGVSGIVVVLTGVRMLARPRRAAAAIA
ncbi:MAG TPA: hypothetical protein VGQ20_06500 [Acidimicrobiales bacterium]|nr:hypothetical protein [Acidimicrobiales bacterium]